MVTRDSRWHREAAANGDLPVPQDCQARANGIAHTQSAIKVKIIGVGKVCPISGTTFSNSLTARIATLQGENAALRTRSTQEGDKG